jgi:hypothetical protein
MGAMVEGPFAHFPIEVEPDIIATARNKPGACDGPHSLSVHCRGCSLQAKMPKKAQLWCNLQTESHPCSKGEPVSGEFILCHTVNKFSDTTNLILVAYLPHSEMKRVANSKIKWSGYKIDHNVTKFVYSYLLYRPESPSQERAKNAITMTLLKSNEVSNVPFKTVVRSSACIWRSAMHCEMSSRGCSSMFLMRSDSCLESWWGTNEQTTVR